MAEPIESALARKLDGYTVTALPPGFTERLVAAALADAAPSRSELPTLRRSPARRWLRGGVAGLGFIAVGLISISAAAMGYFGEPIRHAVERAPVVGKVIERVLPRSLHRLAHVAPAKLIKPVATPVQAPEPVAPVLEEAQPARLSPIERRQRLRAILADPEARRAWVMSHPKAAQRIAWRRAAFQRRRSEAVLGPLARMPLQGSMRPLLRREGLSPVERRERIEQFRERRQLMRERRGMLRERGYRPMRGEP